MPPFLRFILTRLLSIPITLLVITMLLYGFVMLTPPEQRATLYFPKGGNPNREPTPELIHTWTENIIQKYHLRDPFPVQYGIWVLNLVRGNWGWSPVLNEDVLAAILRRIPVTAELTTYSILFFIPLGLVAGVIAGARKDHAADHRFRLAAYIATSIPPMILAITLMAIFYVAVYWFPPERLGVTSSLLVNSAQFHHYTGFLTIDGFLNGRPDISLEAARHLVLPVITLGLLHWATLGRVTRATMIEELQKEYIVAGKAHGLTNHALVWKHAFRNTMTPSLNSSALSAASLVTGVFIVEVIFNFQGISDLVVFSTRDIPDLPTVLGFAIYSVLIVLIIMLILDIIMAIFDPRYRKGIMGI